MAGYPEQVRACPAMTLVRNAGYVPLTSTRVSEKVGALP